MKKLSYLTLLTLCVSVVLTACHPESFEQDDSLIPGEEKILRHDNAVPNSYLVVFKPTVRAATSLEGTRLSVHDVASDITWFYGATLTNVYSHSLQGFSAQMSAEQAREMALDENVLFVEEDAMIWIDASQSDATQGLDRVDQRSLPLNQNYDYDQTGAGVHAYVLDTGLRNNHGQFDGRIGEGFNALGDIQGTADCNGHGTHVAGTLGGTTWGVAKSVTIHPVRVLSCAGGGTISQIVAGIDWVTANHIKPAVANMSLGGPASPALDLAIENSINAGVNYAIAAGNSGTDACGVSPARVPSAITVGAIESSTDTRASFSNIGSCVDIFAPGVNITSDTWFTVPESQVLSGTSMAAPHVAGAMALYLELDPNASVTTVTEAILNTSTKNAVIDAGPDSPNRLLYTLGMEGATGPFSVSPSPFKRGIAPGNNTTYTITVNNNGDFDDTVELSISGLPSGVSASFSPSSITGGEGSTLTVSTSSSTLRGEHSLTITGTSGSETSVTTVILEVADPDFSLSANPSAQKVAPEGSASYSVDVNRVGGFDELVGLTVSGLPSGVSASFNSTVLTPPGTSTLTVTTGTSTPDGLYTLTIEGNSGNLTHTVDVTLEVRTPDFVLSISPSEREVQGGKYNLATFSLRIDALHGYTGTISFSVEGVPDGARALTLNPSTIYPNWSGLTKHSHITMPASTPAGTYPLTYTVTDGTRTRTETVTLIIQP